MTQAANDASESFYTASRHDMVEEVAAMARAVAPSYGGGPLSPRVLAAMERVPRHRFVPEPERRFAYDNRPLPIGHGQTISQPYIVALMSDLLHVGPGSKVLEIGTGSGYQAAVLAEMGVEVYSIEIVESLADEAAKALAAVGYPQVQVRSGDGQAGWPSRAPFDAIIVTAGAERIPAALMDQLKPGGRLVIPVGGIYETQDLLLIEKAADGSSQRRHIIPVRFVPLTGGR